jgi:serine/threonine protein kinase
MSIEPFSADLAADLERICRAFQAAWGAGERPMIEEYLGGAPSSLRAALLRELLRIDLLNRCRHSEKPTPEEYGLRFPAEGGLIQAVFREAPSMVITSAAGLPRTVAHAVDQGRVADWPAVPGYEILGRLAPGGMGVVYRARQITLNRTVALKMIGGGSHAGPQERARFRVEAEAIASLSHPHIIQIYDYGEYDGMPYLAMEFADGGSLAQRLLGGPLPAREAAELVEILARALQFVHERGVIHRDLKPANVLLQRVAGSPSRETSSNCGRLLITDYSPKIADFGLAKRLDHDEGLTWTRAVLGTANYMAPEQATGDKHAIGPAADIYALGAILYEVLTGRPPFRAETRELTIHKLLSAEPRPPTQIQADVPVELEAICLKCLEKEPGRRFANALAVADDLRRYLRGEPISIQAFGAFERHARSARRSGYEILESLGAGDLGSLYKARHLSLNRTVVLEMIETGERFEPARLERLRPEVESVAQLHHPNIVEVYDLGELNGDPFVAREYVEGSSLADGFAGPAQPAQQIAGLVETLARAVHHAHLRGIVHGNLSRSKVLLGRDGTCKITGFGLAGVWGSLGRAEPMTAAADVYALGVVLYELLIGRPPVPTDRAAGQGAALLSSAPTTPEPPRHSRPEVPRELESICLKCLDKEPAGRYPTAAALAEDLRRFRTGEVLFIDDLDDPAQQQRWAGRAGYEIVELLGQTQQVFTYKARQVALNRLVILRRIAARYRFVPVAKERFRWEARTLAHLRHPNIVQLYDQGEQNDLTYFAREFVDGHSAAEMVADAPLLAREAADLVVALARAVQAAHGAGIVHGGLYPGNVHLTLGGVPKITSFRRAWLPGSATQEVSPESEIRRRVCYLAPEQLERKRRLERATDIYALGAILYTLLTGQPPFVGLTLEETLSQARSQAPAPPRRWQPGIPPEVETICLRCLEKEPGRRPADAEALADELGKAVR